MHNNNNYQCKMCWNKALTFDVGSTTQFPYIPLCSPNTCKDVFNPNITTFQSNCAEGLHFSQWYRFGTMEPQVVPEDLVWCQERIFWCQIICVG